MEDSTDGRSLADLRQAERIRYFPGQLLTADDFAMEQDYWRGKGQLHNRLHLGQGVVCGLDVTPLTGTANGVRISPGLALDAWGREIVVPTVVELLPLRLSDDCDPVASGDEPLPRSVHVTICYREHAGRRREVAAEPDPEPTSQGGHGGQVGSLVESYCLRVQQGAAPVVSNGEDAQVLELVQSGRLHDALCLLTVADCATVTVNPCVVLANIEVGQVGSLTVDACSPRLVVPTNRLLLRLAHILSARPESNPM